MQLGAVEAVDDRIDGLALARNGAEKAGARRFYGCLALRGETVVGVGGGGGGGGSIGSV